MLLNGLSMVVFLIFVMSSPHLQESQECVLLLSFLDLSLSLFLLGVFLGDFMVVAHPRQPQPQPRRRRRESQREEEEVLVRWSPCRQYSRMMT